MVRRPGMSVTQEVRERIPHARILAALREECGEPADLLRIYRERVLPAPTRTVHLLGRKCNSKIMETLLGFELQAGYKRIQCPDSVTARYLRVFADIGCRTVKLPYDPTITAEVVPIFEAFDRALRKGVAARYPGSRRIQVYVLKRVCAHLRRQLKAR